MDPGTIAGAAVSGTLGIGQMIAGGIKNSKANKIVIDEVDQEQQSLAQTILAKMRAADTGAAYNATRDKLSRDNATVAKGIVQVSGGQAGSAATNLTRLAESTNTAFNNVLAVGQQQEQYYTGLASHLISNIAQRRLEVRMADKLQKKTEATQMLQDGFGNMAGAATMLAVGGGEGGDFSTQLLKLFGNKDGKS